MIHVNRLFIYLLGLVLIVSVNADTGFKSPPVKFDDYKNHQFSHLIALSPMSLMLSILPSPLSSIEVGYWDLTYQNRRSPNHKIVAQYSYNEITTYHLFDNDVLNKNSVISWLKFGSRHSYSFVFIQFNSHFMYLDATTMVDDDQQDISEPQMEYTYQSSHILGLGPSLDLGIEYILGRVQVESFVGLGYGLGCEKEDQGGWTWKGIPLLSGGIQLGLWF